MIQIDLFSDIICPWCYIGRSRLKRALETRKDLEIKINWRAFQLNPEMPREGIPRQQYLALKFGNKERAASIYSNIQKAGELEGLIFNFDKISHTPNTVLAHRFIDWSKMIKKSEKTVQKLFIAYFVEGRNIGLLETLREIAFDLEMDTDEFDDYFESDEGLNQVKADTRFAIGNGITGVPYFIFNKQFAITGAQEPEAFLPLLDLKAEQEF